MSTQPYFSNKLGFDPNEAMYEGTNGNVKNSHGYEENLTKFKGTTCWGFFIESQGMVKGFMFAWSDV